MSNLLSVTELSLRLKLHPITIRRYIKSGKLTAVKIGGAIRVSEEALKDFSRSISLLKRSSPTHLQGHRRQPFSIQDPLWHLKGIGAYTERQLT